LHTNAKQLFLHAFNDKVLKPRKLDYRVQFTGPTGTNAIALSLTFTENQSVFALVIMAWSGLASAFAPLLLVLCLGQRPSEKLAIVMMISGLVTATAWRAAGLADAVYEGMPGILVGLIVFLVGSRLVQQESNSDQARTNP
jgi:sodium/proline symporter